MKRIESPNPNLDMVHQDVMRQPDARKSCSAFMNGIGNLLDNAINASLGNGATEQELQPFRDLASTLQHNKDCFVEALCSNGLVADAPTQNPELDRSSDPGKLSDQTTAKTPEPTPITPAVGTTTATNTPAPNNAPTANTGPSKPVTVPTAPTTPPKT